MNEQIKHIIAILEKYHLLATKFHDLWEEVSEE